MAAPVVLRRGSTAHRVYQGAGWLLLVVAVALMPWVVSQSKLVLLSQAADAFNTRAVEFRLEEQIPNTSQWRIYQRVLYTLRRSFTTDFDF